MTGGGTGIGRSIAIELAILGATVVIASRDVDRCLSAADEMNQEIQQASISRVEMRDDSRGKVSSMLLQDAT